MALVGMVRAKVVAWVVAAVRVAPLWLEVEVLVMALNRLRVCRPKGSDTSVDRSSGCRECRRASTAHSLNPS